MRSSSFAATDLWFIQVEQGFTCWTTVLGLIKSKRARLPSAAEPGPWNVGAMGSGRKPELEVIWNKGKPAHGFKLWPDVRCRARPREHVCTLQDH